MCSILSFFPLIPEMATPLLPLIGGEAFRNIKTEFEKRIDEFYYNVYTKRWTRYHAFT